MTNPEVFPRHDVAGPKVFGISNPFVAVLAGLLLLFLLSGLAGGVSGYTSVAAEHGALKAVDVLIIGLLIGACLLCLWAMYRLAVTFMCGQPISSKTRKARTAIITAMAVSGLIGGAFVFADQDGNSLSGMFSNGPVLLWFAIGAIVIWLVVLLVSTYFWWRNIDEHEAEAYRDGAFWTSNFYLIVTPVWWIGWRGGFLPAPEHMIIFCIAVLIWTIIWTWRRYA